MTAENLMQGMQGSAISLLLGHPDPTTLLTPELQLAAQKVMSTYQALQYGAEQGAPMLIRFLVERLNREQGLSIQPENMMIVAGSTHAVDLSARLYTAAGSVVLVEAPSYVDALHVFHDHHAKLYSVPMDEQGMIVAELERLLAQLKSTGKTPSLLYTIPNFHNPTGITLPKERRLAIIELARHYGFRIVEDDVYRDLSFDGHPVDSFYALAEGKQVLSIGSFSKTLAPGLRLGWLVGSADDIQRGVHAGTSQMGGGANPFTAQIVAEFCCAGHWERHVEQLRSLYQKRRDVALSALSRAMPDGVTWTTPAGGFFIWLTLPEGLSAQDVKQAAAQRGVVVAAGNGFFVTPSDGTRHLRLAFSYAPPDDLEKGIILLGETIRSLLP